MARKTDIRLRRSAVSGSVPGGADLNLGELALNTADGAIFVKNGAGDIITVSHDGILHYDEPNSRIGIGTTSPGKPLDVLGDIRSIDGSSNQHQLRATQVISYGTDAILNAQSVGDDVRLNTQGTTRLIATAEGNVGIGTTTADSKLVINGTSGEGWDRNLALAMDGTVIAKIVSDSDGTKFRNMAAGDHHWFRNSGNNTTAIITDGGLLGVSKASPAFRIHTSSAMGSSPSGVIYMEMSGTNTTGGGGAIRFDTSASNTDNSVYYASVEGVRTDSQDGSNELRFYTSTQTVSSGAPQQRMVISELGDVGIGTASPRAKLDVNGSINVEQATSIALDADTYTDTAILIPRGTGIRSNTTGDYQRNLLSHNGTSGNGALQIGQQGTSIITDILVYPGSSGNIRFFPSGSEDVRFASSGNVGIGNTNPVARLDVAGQDAGPVSIFDYGYATNNSIRVFGNESAIDIVGNDNGTHASSLLLRNSNEGFALINNPASDRLEFKSFTSTADDFKVHNTGVNVSNLVDILTLEKNGNVGIGTDSPLAKLDVRGDIELNSTYPVIRFKDSDSENDFSILGGSGLFRIYDEDATASRLSINSSGNVGIGTDSPSTKLEVAGDLTLPSNGQIKFKGTNHYPRIYAASNDLKINLDNGSGSNYEAFRIENTTGAITFNNAFTFPTSIGTSGQILKVPSSGTELVWASETASAPTQLVDADGDTSVTVEANADEDIIRFNVAGSEVGQVTDDGIVLNDGYNFEGDVIGAIKFKAQAGEALTKGDAVYISGISGNTTIVSKADANDAAKMPAFGLAASTVSLNAAVQIITFGTLLGIDTSSYSEGDELYVNVLAGTLTDSAPTGSTSALQKIAKVTRSDASAGSVKVSGAGRTNATPNLDEGKIFVGNSSNQSVQVDDTIHVDMANSRVGINTDSPGSALDVAGQVEIDTTNPMITLKGDDSIWYRVRVDETNDRLELGHSTNKALYLSNSGNSTFNYDLTVQGDLTVNGTTTTLNTATLDVEDLNITVADGAANAAAADGGGLTVDGANATWTYSSADDAWASNKHAQFYTSAGTGTLSVGRTSNQAIQLYVNDNQNRIFAYQDSDENGNHYFDLVRSFAGTGRADFRIMNGSSVHMLVDKDGNVGIGSAAPDEKLVVRGGNYASNQNGGIAVQMGDEASSHWKSALKIKSDSSGNARTVIEATTGATAGQTNDAIQINTAGEVGFLNNIGVNIGGNPGHRIHVQETGVNNAAFYMTDGTSWMRLVPNLGTSGYNSLSTTGDIGLIFSTDGDNTTDNGTTGLVIAPHSQNAAKGIKIMESGQVGIGTASPSRKLHIVGAGGTQAVKVQATDTSQASLDLRNSNSWFRLVAQSGELFVYDQSDTAERFRIDTDGNVGIGTNNPVQKLQVDGNIYSNGGEFFVNNNKGISAVGDLILKTNDGTNYNTTMHLDGADRFVGIGTTTPAGNLHIKSIDNIGDANLIIEADADNNVESDNPRLELRQDNNLVSGALYLEGNASQTANGTYANSLVIDSKASSTANSHAIHFVTGGLAANQTGGPTNGSVKMTIDSAGLVGIGLNNPSAGLHVKRSGFPQLKLEDADDSMQIGFSGDVFYLKRSDNDSDIRFRRTDNTDPFVFNMASKFFEIQGGTGVASSGTAVIRQKGDTSNDGIAITSLNATSHRIWKGSDGALNIGSSTVPNAFTQLINGDLGLGSTSPDTKLDITTSGVEGLIMNQDTGASSVSSRLFFKDATRTNLIMNVNGLLEFRTDAAIGSTSGTRRLFISPSLVETSVPIKIEEYQINTTETSTTATTQVEIHTLAAADFRSARYTVQVTNSTDSTYHTTEILMVHDGTTANITEFGEVHTGASVEATFDADINSGNVRLLATPASADSMEFKVVCHSLTV